MGRFDISPEVAEEFRTKFREAVMPHVDEEILAVGTFRTTGSGTKFAVSKLQAGAAVYGAVSKLGRARAAGLPNTFLLVVTPTKVRAFKYKLKGRGVDAKQEVASWDRAGLTAKTDPMQTTTRVTLEWPDSGDKLVCDKDGMGDNPWADDVIRVLEAGPQVTA